MTVERKCNRHLYRSVNELILRMGLDKRNMATLETKIKGRVFEGREAVVWEEWGRGIQNTPRVHVLMWILFYMRPAWGSGHA